MNDVIDDETHLDISADSVEVTTKYIIVNSGWTPNMVRLNTLSTLGGAIISLFGLAISVVALVFALRK